LRQTLKKSVDLFDVSLFQHGLVDEFFKTWIDVGKKVGNCETKTSMHISVASSSEANVIRSTPQIRFSKFCQHSAGNSSQPLHQQNDQKETRAEQNLSKV
jgi:hypothetical protein